MSDAVIREYRGGDIPEMSELWQTVFGDSEGFVDSFLRLLPGMGTAAVAEVNGKIAGAAYAVTGMELVSTGGKVQTCGYIYAVAVAPEFRGSGTGRALTERSAELARARGAEVICTLPAEESLYAWYKTILGTECALHRQRFEVKAADIVPVQSLSAAEYGQRREALLKDRCRLRPLHTTLEFQRRFCEELGGGLYTCGGGICAAYIEGGAAVIKELIAPVGTDAAAIAASIGAALGTERAVYYLPATDGEPYLAAEPGSVPADCVWNITFD